MTGRGVESAFCTTRSVSCLIEAVELYSASSGLETRWAGACRSAMLCQRRTSSLSSIFAQDGRTPLCSAARKGHESVVRLLLYSKAAVDNADNVGGIFGC
jgi:ankyrin repeat protein